MKAGKSIAWIVFVLLVILPVSASLVYAFLYSVGLTGLLSDGYTIAYWQQLRTNSPFFFSLLYSMIIAVISIGLAVCIALWLTLRYGTTLQRRNISFILLLPLGIPAVVAALMTYQLLSPSGWLSRLTYAVGLTAGPDAFPALINDRLAVGIIITHIILAVPYFTALFRNIYRQEQGDLLLLTARNLGAENGQASRTIVIPLLLRSAFPSVLMFLLFVMGSYEIPLLLGVSDPRMLSPLIADKMFRFDLLDKPLAYAMLVSYVLLVLLLNMLLLRKNARHA